MRILTWNLPASALVQEFLDEVQETFVPKKDPRKVIRRPKKDED